ncbi:MAG: phage late control D family protein [Marmoricola sp.]
MPFATSYTSTPTMKIGGNLSTAAMRDLIALSVEEDLHGMCALEAVLTNWGSNGQKPDYLYLDRKTLDFGTKLEIGFGPTGSDVRLFSGKVSALQADFPATAVATVTISAEDSLQDFRFTRRTRTFDDSTSADIASQMASEHGLTPQVDLDGPSRKVVNQLNLSDLAFLRELARADGAEVWLDDTTLHLQKRSDRDAGNVTLTYGGNLVEFSVRADLAHQCTDLSVTGWSVTDKEAITEKGDVSALGSELGQDTSGADILAAAFADRHESLVVAEPLASDDARSRANAAYLDRARRFVCGTGSTAGTPSLRVGTRVTLAGLGPVFNGDYRVTRTRHHFDLVGGYRTDFDVERVGIGATS